MADYSVEELVSGVYTSVKSLAAEKKLGLRIAVPPGLPPARGDERRLAQALFNLVGNAIKFTDAGEVRIEVETKGDSYIFSVQDTGPGIDEADQTKIFQEFQQVDNSITKTKGRRGIGPRDRKAHCGDAWWTNLDRIPPRPWRDLFLFGASPARATGDADMSKRVLVVEDQEDNRQILRDLLASVGYEMIEAHDGEGALIAARTQSPDLILMDIQLPILDGYEATRRIKAQSDLRHIPIVVVTSYALSGDEEKARAAGCDAYVAKPYSARKLLETINRYLT